MKVDAPEVLAPEAPEASEARDPLVAAAAATKDNLPSEVFIQVGTITRLLHDTLQQLGVMPHLQEATVGLPDARSRLSYIVDKTTHAAEKVLTTVDQAKAEQAEIAARTKALVEALTKDPVKAVASGMVMNFASEVEAASERIDGHLTDIMLAQDFHDLTGQVVAKVVTLANQLESSLLKLLVQVIPPDQLHKVQSKELDGPVVNPTGRTDVVADQGEVDDLLASLGF